MDTTARRVAGLVTASAVTLGLLLTGTGTALADDPGTTATQGPITLSPEQATYVCATRIPAILSRVDRVTTRINADAATRGSTAFLRARHDKAQAAGRTEEADRIQKRIDGRPAALDKLADAKKRATEFRDANCAA
jgi:riboflavin biosynthesis pyrimidine reductase